MGTIEGKENNVFLIDWLAFTVPVEIDSIGKKGVEDVLNALNLNEWPWEPQEKGRNGYNRSLKLQEYATVYFNEIKYTEIPSGREDLLERYKKMGVNVEFTGKGCRIVEKTFEWVEFLTEILKIGGRITRLDVALDDFNELLDFSIIENKIKNGEVISLTRTRKVDERFEFLKREDFDNRGASKGKTLYFGKRGSEFLLRLYDKKKEQENKKIFVEFDSWQRYEMELRKEKAIDFVKHLCDGMELAELYLAVLNAHIRFVDPVPNQKNRSRWPISDFWKDFLNDTKKVKLDRKNLDPKINKSIEWFDSSVFATMQLLAEVAELGGVDLFEILKNVPKKERSERHKEMLKDFKSLETSEKQDILKKIASIGR